MKRTQLLLVMALTALLLASGCVVPTAPVTAPQATEAPAEPAEPGEKVTLRVWDTWTEENQSAGMDKMIATFQETHPNIEIVRDPQTFDEMRPVIQTALSAGEGPDILYYDTGPGYAGVLANAGLLLPLDDAYEEKGWLDRFHDWTRRRLTINDQLYGVGNEVEFVGVYYNREIFDELGVEEPETFEEFIQIADKAKEAGYVPIAFSDGSKWPAYHAFSIMANYIGGIEKMNEVFFGDGRWDAPEFVEGIKTWFVDMNNAGYFLPDPTAIKYEDGNAVFYAGDAAMNVTGTWLLSEVEANAPFEVGLFLFPSIEGSEVVPPGGLGSAYYVSSKTSHSEEAIEFLDFMFSDEGAKIWLEDMAAIPPVPFDSAGLEISPLLKQALDIISTTSLGYIIDSWVGDQFNNAMGDGFQAVLLGQKTPEEMAQELQAVWESEKNE